MLAVAQLDGVLITDVLHERPAAKIDYLQEKLALQDLARQMGENPQALLPRLVAHAMEVCGADSAGISLYEPQPGSPGIFRWHHLFGRLKVFEGATTPRDFSPCGVCLDQTRPILMKEPERIYGWISDAGITVPEVLLVPLYIGSNVPLGTLWIVASVDQQFDSGHARVLTELAAFAGVALRMLQTEQRLTEALDHQQTLTQEMSHRVKNLFSVTGALVSISARSASSAEEMAEILAGRLSALGRAHGTVRRSFAEEGHGSQTADLSELVHTILEPYAEASGKSAGRLTQSGPDVRMGERAVNSLALVLHELATNAAKYGALKNDNGSVSVVWNTSPDELTIQWRERGGPSIASAPEKTGFGSKLAQRGVVEQLGGQLIYDWQPEGLSIDIVLPMASLGR